MVSSPPPSLAVLESSDDEGRHKSGSAHAAHHSDPYYGHEDTAKLCACFVTHLFTFPDLPPFSTVHPPTPSPPLALFIAYALHRTRLHSSVTFAALYLLQRLKARFPAARGSSEHRLFISAFTIASKGIFTLREIYQMEREMCSCLEWQLKRWRRFEIKVRRDFKGSGPYPTYMLPPPAPLPVPSTTRYASTGPSAATPSFAAKPSTPPPKMTSPSVPAAHLPAPYLPPPSSPDTPDTPESSHSTSTSPASSAPPPTPPGYEDYNVRIVTSGNDMAISVDSAAPAPAPVHVVQHKGTLPPATTTIPAYLKKGAKCVELFEHATPCVW